MLVAGSVGPYGACQHDGSEYTGKYVENMTIQVLGKEFKLFFFVILVKAFYYISHKLHMPWLANLQLADLILLYSLLKFAKMYNLY